MGSLVSTREKTVKNLGFTTILEKEKNTEGDSKYYTEGDILYYIEGDNGGMFLSLYYL